MMAFGNLVFCLDRHLRFGDGANNDYGNANGRARGPADRCRTNQETREQWSHRPRPTCLNGKLLSP